jgi:hypothetical protein
MYTWAPICEFWVNPMDFTFRLGGEAAADGSGRQGLAHDPEPPRVRCEVAAPKFEAGPKFGQP